MHATCRRTSPRAHAVSIYALVFLGGLAGSLHCVGMCGGFPLALAAAGRAGNLRRQLLYNLGRLNTLIAIGALAGGAGAAVVTAAPMLALERTLAIVAGLFMLAVGLEGLGLLGGVTAWGARLAQATVGRLLGGVIRSGHAGAALALGVFNAFLPCHLIYAFAARAASTASIAEGMLTMLAFGLGTVPAMLGVGALTTVVPLAARPALSRAAGVLVLALGILTIARGAVVPPAHHH
jgi:sulfite exporter TauE/SafE